MKFLRYLMFSVAAIGAVIGMVYLEQETSVVRSFKATLGLEVSPVEADGVGMLGMAQGLLNGGGDLSSLTALMSTRTGPSAGRYLPEALPGWMRADDDVDPVELSQFVLPQMAEGGANVAGAYYFREDVKLLIVIASLPKDAGIGGSDTTQATELSVGDDPGRVMEWQGRRVPIRRDGAGQSVVHVKAGDAFMVSLHGDVSAQVMKSYLDAIPLFDVLGAN